MPPSERCTARRGEGGRDSNASEVTWKAVQNTFIEPLPVTGPKMIAAAQLSLLGGKRP